MGNKRVAYFANNMLHFQHQDWTGTERMRTTFNGAVEGTFTSMSFGDAFATVSGSDGDPAHYAMFDHDYSSDTDHAQFRQYSSTPGRWMSPDPYDGSYDPSNPQSFNRYSYVLNNPMSLVDPTGLDDDGRCGHDDCIADDPCQDGEIPCFVDPSDTEPTGGECSTSGCSITVTPGPDDPPLGLCFTCSIESAPSPYGSGPGAPNNIPCPVSAASINSYLASKNSPMAGQGNNFINTGTQYNLDPRLLVSLAGAESTFGTVITAGQFNALNVMYAGYNSNFSSFQSNIHSAGKSLTNPANGYNLTNTSTMYSTYCSGSGCAAGLKNLNTFMKQQGANTNALHNPC